MKSSFFETGPLKSQINFINFINIKLKFITFKNVIFITKYLIIVTNEKYSSIRFR